MCIQIGNQKGVSGREGCREFSTSKYRHAHLHRCDSRIMKTRGGYLAFLKNRCYRQQGILIPNVYFILQEGNI